MIIIKILALIAAWLLFYNVLKARKKGLPGIKATIVTLLFATLIFRFSDDLTAWVNKTFFPANTTSETSINKSSTKPVEKRKHITHYTVEE